MIEDAEGQEFNKYAHTVLGTIESVFPSETLQDNFRERVLSGDPEQIRAKCGYAGELSVAIKLTETLSEKVVSAQSAHEDSNGHQYLFIPSRNLIIDPTAGQFIPLASRKLYEPHFIGNMFIGNRAILKTIAQNGVVNTQSQADSGLSFKRIWGEESSIISD